MTLQMEKVDLEQGQGIEEGEEESHDVLEREVVGGEQEEAALFVHALEGSQGSYTIRVLGQHRIRQLVILVDNGSTHSFLDERVVKEIKILIVRAPTVGVTVTVADGRKVLSTNMSLGFSWKIQNHSFTFDVRLLPLRSFVMILRVDWVKMHNPVFDFENTTVSIQWQ